MIFFLLYIAVALLIVAGYLEFPIFSEGLSLPEHFSLLLLVFYLAANMFRFAPLYPLLLALIRGLTSFRLSRGLAIVLAGFTGLFGFVFTLLMLAFSGAGGELVFMQGITLTMAVCASLLLLSPKQGVVSEFFRVSWFLLMVPASAAVWSLASAGEVVQSANRIAGDHPFCLARHTGSTTPIRTFAQLRGFSFFTNASGYKSTRPPGPASKFCGGHLLIQCRPDGPGAVTGNEVIGGEGHRGQCVAERLRDGVQDVSHPHAFLRYDVEMPGQIGPVEQVAIGACQVGAMDERPAGLPVTPDLHGPAFPCGLDEAVEDAAVCVIDHRRMEDRHGKRRSCQKTRGIADHPRKCRDGIETAVLGRDHIAGLAIEPASAGVDQARFVPRLLRGPDKRRNNLRIDVPHIVGKGRRRMNDGIVADSLRRPACRRAQVTPAGIGPKPAKLVISHAGAAERRNLMGSPAQLRRDRRPDRPRSAQYEHPHAVRSPLVTAC